MIPVFTSLEMRELDRSTIEDYGIAGVVLMEHAGLAVARAARDLLPGGEGRVCLVCGKGNNGGDGFVAARWLHHWGLSAGVFLAGSLDDVGGDARTNLDILFELGLTVEEVEGPHDTARLERSLAGAGVVIDALLGTGLGGPPREPVATVIGLVDAAPAPILAVDLPSGINADTGEAYHPHIVADRTLTFGGLKRGLALHPGLAAAGRVEVVDIGIPRSLLDSVDGVPLVLERADVADMLPRRAPDAHKGDTGRVVVIGGSRGLGGAVLLAGRAAARGGAGLVTVAVPESLASAADAASLEVMSRPLPETADGGLAAEALQPLEPLLEHADAVAIGPGLGTDPAAAELLGAVAHRLDVPLVIDADGLNLVAAQPGRLEGVTAPLVLTPHPGEAARLLRSDVAAVQADRLTAAAELARRYGAVAVLKGARTVIATPQGGLLINPTGNPAMASGGMGDALTGLIAALLAQGLAPVDAAAAGVWLHGRAGDLAAQGSDAGLLAGDVIERLPQARADLR